MSSNYTARKGEHVAGIAEQHGFRLFRTVWDHPGNDALKQRRQNPNTLLEGDVVFIPDKDRGLQSAASGRLTTFVIQSETLMLRVVALMVDRTPVAGMDWSLEHDAGSASNVTTTDGLAEAPIPKSAKHGTLTVDAEPTELDIGALDPIEESSGCQQRLINLGYLQGPVGAADDQELRSAIEEFECDSSLTLTGICDGATREELLRVHGC